MKWDQVGQVRHGISTALSMYFQEGVQEVDIVLTTYLEHWNGLDHAPLIMKLLARCKMYPFECKYIDNIHSLKASIMIIN